MAIPILWKHVEGVGSSAPPFWPASGGLIGWAEIAAGIAGAVPVDGDARERRTFAREVAPDPGAQIFERGGAEIGDLVQEAVVTVPRALIAETIDLIAVLAGRGAARRLAELATVKGLGPNGDYLLTPAGDP